MPTLLFFGQMVAAVSLSFSLALVLGWLCLRWVFELMPAHRQPERAAAVGRSHGVHAFAGGKGLPREMRAELRH